MLGRFTLIVFALTSASFARSASSQTRPNVILVMTDDQGYGDLGAHGNEVIRTPHIDQLASESVRLTDFHVDPTCSPTRAALLTGRYSTRTGVWHTVMGRSLLRGDEVTLAEILAQDGYRTAMIGKWHLGDNVPSRPQDNGFHEAFYHRGGVVGQVGDWFGNNMVDDTYFRSGKPEKTTGYATDVWFDEAIQFVERNREEPFFLYLATNAAHWPYLVDEEYWRPYAERGLPKTMARFYGMIENVDDNMGRLLARLDALGLSENTIFVFMTDNGSAEGFENWRGEPGSFTGFNAGMRAGKGSEYDGGHRVPFFVRWPEGGIHGGRDVDDLTAHIDVLPTIAELTGASIPETLALDGRSLAPILKEDAAELGDRTLFVHSQRIDTPVRWRHSAVMTEQWRLINGEELYDIGADPDQSVDVADEQPAVVERLRSSYDGWWASLSPVFGEVVRIGIGSEAENPVELTSHDWRVDDEADVAWAARHVYAGLQGNGYWALDVLRGGHFRVELRRWPRHMGLWMEVVKAKLRIGDLETEATLSHYDTVAVFDVELPPGPTELQTWLIAQDGTEKGAYFVDIERVR